MTLTATTITIMDLNEAKALFAWSFSGIPSPRQTNIVDFDFEASDALFDARRANNLNYLVPILSLIAASMYIDRVIYEHRERNAGNKRQ